MARSHSASIRMGDILVPARIISILLENNEGDCTLEELCELYLKSYLENSGKIGAKRETWI